MATTRRVIILTLLQGVYGIIQTCQNCQVLSCNDHVNVTNQEACKSRLGCCSEKFRNAATYVGKDKKCFSCDEPRVWISGATTFLLTNNTDSCTWFTLYSRTGYAGSGTNLSSSTCIKPSYCIKSCLEYLNCRGVEYEWDYQNQNYCYCTLYDSVESIADGSTKTFVSRECVVEEPLRNITQICHNCDLSPYCPQSYKSMWTQIDNRCSQLSCPTTGECKAVMFYPRWEDCVANTCHRVIQDMDKKVYRMSNSRFCPEYEVFTYVSQEGNCPSFQNFSEIDDGDHCLEKCLDADGCLAASFRNNQCRLHNSCTDVDPATDATFYKRICLNETCTPTLVQFCLNCKPDPASCPGPFNVTNNNYFPLDINTEPLITNPNDTWSIAYSYQENKDNTQQCRRVVPSSGRIVYRGSCTEDCTVYKLFELLKHKGTSDVIITLDGGVHQEYCIERCLDMTGCKGVTVTKSLDRKYVLKCLLHSSDSYEYTGSSTETFIWRKCIERPVRNITQTCRNCKIIPKCSKNFIWNSDLIGDHCPQNYTNTSQLDPPCNQDFVYNTNTQYFPETCFNILQDDPRSETVMYSRERSVCRAYQCSQVEMSLGDVAYRRSHRQDCRMYEMFLVPGVSGTCDVQDHDEGSTELTFDSCVETCLDMPECKAMSYLGNHHNDGTRRCNYHTCANYTPSAQNYYLNSKDMFMKLRCIENECVREYKQHCLDCRPSTGCQLEYVTLSLATREACHDALGLDTLGGPDMLVYDSRTGACGRVNCSQVEQEMFTEVYRWSCVQDCPIYYIYTLPSSQAYNCSELDFDDGGISLDYCVERCLDMAGCRSVTYDEVSLQCRYHDCTESETRTELNRYTFVKRVCVEESYPTKSYTQTCINCQNLDCHLPVSNQPDVFISHNCNESCSECDVTYYDTQSDSCSYYQCDSPWFQGPGTTLTRKSPDPDCLRYELFKHTNVYPMCNTSLLVIDGITDVNYCLRQCLDVTGCRSVTITDHYCTLYECDEYSEKMPSETLLGFIPSMATVMFSRRCAEECTASRTQTCINCKPGPECQSPYLINVTSNRCNSTCDQNQHTCKGFEPDGSLSEGCDFFQCNEVELKLRSVFRRKTCKAECPLYELYTIPGAYGKCNVTATEHFVLYPWLCMQKCLDMSGCIAVTWKEKTCEYHDCDCYAQSEDTLDYMFMYMYCLDNMTMATDLSLPLRRYPRTCPQAKPIYLRACGCSTGSLLNKTVQQITKEIVANLTVPPVTTSAYRRSKTSASDERGSSKVVGTLGSILFGLSVGLVVLLDSTRFYVVIHKLIHYIRKKYRESRHYVQTWVLNPDVEMDIGIEDLTHAYT